MGKLTRCDHPNCNRRSRVMRECILCEKKGKVHLINACDHHPEWLMEKLKRHVLLKHPGTIPTLVVAALKGEDVF